MEIFVIITGCIGSFDFVRAIVITCKHRVPAVRHRGESEVRYVEQEVEHEIVEYIPRRPVQSKARVH